MSTASSMNVPGYEQVVGCQDPASGLRAIIAIHDTTLGPALGGCRMYAYDGEEQALDDVLRLSRGMTYKSAMAELPFWRRQGCHHRQPPRAQVGKASQDVRPLCR